LPSSSLFRASLKIQILSRHFVALGKMLPHPPDLCCIGISVRAVVATEWN
jgi:hypothetical protein